MEITFLCMMILGRCACGSDKTIESYVDAGLTEQKSDCYIRYDVAHFFKNVRERP